jgi:group II intron reverse transcriptase/maturase
MNLILDKNNIELAYRNIKNNKGSNTAGVDGLTIKDISELDNETLYTTIVNRLKNFIPNKVRRVEIPKPNGKTRPLGIPTIEDRIIQQSIKQILEPIAEAKFYNHSYGFRPLRGADDAMARAYFLSQINNLHYVVDIDIKGFFDNINHGKLLKQLWNMGIRDKTLINIVSKMLKAEIEGIGIPTKGTPQGGILSPLLANINLNELDHWIASQWHNIPTKHQYANANKYRALKESNLKEVFIVRYADDFKLFCRTYEDAEKIFEATKLWLRERLDLEISPEKSKIVKLKKQYSEFLGIKFKVVKKGKKKKNKTDKFVITSKMTEKAIEKTTKDIKTEIKKIRNGKSNIQKLNSIVRGKHNYYSMATNISKDFGKIAFLNNRTIEKKLNAIRLTSDNKVPKYIQEHYGGSKQLRVVNKTIMIPIGFIQWRIVVGHHQKTMFVKSERELIHKHIEDIEIKRIMNYMMDNPIENRNIEYNDNRLSLYIAQKGKCFVTGKLLEIDEIHCHHKKQKAKGGGDEYKNLVILHKDVHRLLHAKNENKIYELTNELKLDDNQAKKLLKLKSMLL